MNHFAKTISVLVVLMSAAAFAQTAVPYPNTANQPYANVAGPVNAQFVDAGWIWDQGPLTVLGNTVLQGATAYGCLDVDGGQSGGIGTGLLVCSNLAAFPSATLTYLATDSSNDVVLNTPNAAGFLNYNGTTQMKWLSTGVQMPNSALITGTDTVRGTEIADAGSYATLSIGNTLANFVPTLAAEDGGAPTANPLEVVGSLSLTAATSICSTYLVSGATVFAASPYCSITIADGTPTISTAPSVDAGGAGICIFEAASTTGHFSYDCKL